MVLWGTVVLSGFSEERAELAWCSWDCGPIWLLLKREQNWHGALRTVVLSGFSEERAELASLKRGQNWHGALRTVVLSGFSEERAELAWCSGDCGPVWLL